MQEKTKNVLLAVLIVGLVSMTVAYAALSTTLTISNGGTIANSKWDIRFENLQNVTVATGTGGAANTAQIVTPAAIDTSTNITISGLSVKFKQPGDTVRYTFDVVNEGDLNAKLTGFTLGTPSSNDVTYTLNCASTAMTNPYTYNSTFDLDAVNGTTKAKFSCQMDITYNASVTEMPEQETTVTFSNTTFNFGQR